ncbi:DUF4031 domain-containing protein [Streptomyces sp. NPDC127197]|uniref:DUF4031 domain-containing protein n=1 Tax=Streptomyces sp. NPDC127197 TaxID=3345388 RepID=UPI003633266A
MSVYVDPLRDYPEALERGLPGRLWCHLTADTKPELHTFASRIGLQRSWFQHGDDYRWHYDLTPGKRALAVRHGAQEVDRAVFVRIVAERRPRRPATRILEIAPPEPAAAPSAAEAPAVAGPLLEWRSSAHWDYASDPSPCHLCGGPTHLLDDNGRHAHKTCVEAWYAAHPDAWAAYQREQAQKRTKKTGGKGKSRKTPDQSQEGLWDH